jgi:hypothetical protein
MAEFVKCDFHIKVKSYASIKPLSIFSIIHSLEVLMKVNVIKRYCHLQDS